MIDFPASATVKNLTRDGRSIRTTARVGVALDSGRQAAREVLERVVAGYQKKSADENARVVLEEFTAQSIVFSVSVWLDDISHLKPARSELNDAIWRELDAADVALA